MQDEICEQCDKTARYGPVNMLRKRCFKHKISGDVTGKRTCLVDGCSITSLRYNFIDNPPRYCRNHRDEGMINVYVRKCELCNTIPTFGKPGTKEALRCLQHKLQDDIDVISKTCEFIPCNTKPTFGKPGTKEALRCSKHKLQDDVDVKNKTCEFEPCTTQPNPRLDNYCTPCFHKIFPDDPRSTKLRLKLREVPTGEYLDTHFPMMFENDKSIFVAGTECSTRRRVDYFTYLQDTADKSIILCIEVDEHYHCGYSVESEKERYHELAISNPGCYFVWLRFNPDSTKECKVKFKTRLEKLMEIVGSEINRIRTTEIIDLCDIKLLYYPQTKNTSQCNPEIYGQHVV